MLEDAVQEVLLAGRLVSQGDPSPEVVLERAELYSALLSVLLGSEGVLTSGQAHELSVVHRSVQSSLSSLSSYFGSSPSLSIRKAAVSAYLAGQEPR